MAVGRKNKREESQRERFAWFRIDGVNFLLLMEVNRVKEAPVETETPTMSIPVP